MTDTPTLSQAAIANGPVLRALAGDQALYTPAQVAEAAGVPAKNIARTLATLEREGLAQGGGGDPWALSPAGRRALAALATWEGAAAGDVLLVRHADLAPNPLQPRQIFDPVDLGELKLAIAGAGEVLAPLIVAPPDPETGGGRMILDGARRWRAVGELIQEGKWPADRPLRALQREASPGQVAFLGLTTNTQVRLTPLEQAYAYQALIEETGWSARHAAHMTGRDPRGVQQMMQVLETALTADIERHRADPRAFTWDDLRRSVQNPSPAQREGTAAKPPGEGESVRAPPPPTHFGDSATVATPPGDPKPPPQRGLTPPEALALAELADAQSRALALGLPLAAEGYTPVRKYWLYDTAAELARMGLVVWNHLQARAGPHGGPTPLGRQRLAEEFPDGPQIGETYQTPWIPDPTALEESSGSGAAPQTVIPVSAPAEDRDPEPDPEVEAYRGVEPVTLGPSELDRRRNEAWRIADQIACEEGWSSADLKALFSDIAPLPWFWNRPVKQWDYGGLRDWNGDEINLDGELSELILPILAALMNFAGEPAE